MKNPTPALLAALALSAPALADGWVALAPMPIARYGAAAIPLGGRIIVIGGYGISGALSDCSSYCEEDSFWRALAPLLAARYNFEYAESEGSIYVAGGRSSPTTTLANLFRFDPWVGTQGSWTELAAHPIPTAGGVGASVYGKFLLTTFDDGTGTARNYLSEYTYLTNTWLQRASSQFVHGRPAGGDLRGTFVVAGGANASGVATNIVEAYNAATNAWSLRAPMPVALKNAAFTVHNGRLWVMGGIDAAGVEQSGVYCYDYNRDQWSTRSDLKSARFNNFAATLEDGIYSFGGQHGSTILNTLDAWGLPCYANCDGSTTAPILSVNDFICYLTKFAEGCKSPPP